VNRRSRNLRHFRRVEQEDLVNLMTRRTPLIHRRQRKDPVSRALSVWTDL